jgi:hypothetical protein
MVRRAWADHATFQHVIGTSICLSSLLEAGRYDELAELLATRRMKFWSWHRFGAAALVRQGLWEAAIAYAEGVRSDTNPGYREISIDRFCEDLLIRHGRSDEAYRRYGLHAVSGTTNLAIYRSLVRAYPDRDHRQMLLDLIETRGDKGKWFAAAKDAGFLDIALDCAAMHNADPSTLVRAARDFCGKEPRFAATVALFAVTHLLTGGGYDPRSRTSTRPSDISLRRHTRLVPSFGPDKNLAGWLMVPAVPAARCSSKPSGPHYRATTLCSSHLAATPHK